MIIIGSLDLQEIAWAAGLFEGEGCFTAKKTGHSPRATLSMMDEDTVQKFYKIVGVGSIFTSYKDKHPMYIWQTGSFEGVQHCVCLFWRWLGERRKKRAKEVIIGAKQIKHNRLKTSCKRGHTYCPNNTWYMHLKSGYTHRVCKVCRKEGFSK